MKCWTRSTIRFTLIQQSIQTREICQPLLDEIVLFPFRTNIRWWFSVSFAVEIVVPSNEWWISSGTLQTSNLFDRKIYNHLFRSMCFAMNWDCDDAGGHGMAFLFLIAPMQMELNQQILTVLLFQKHHYRTLNHIFKYCHDNPFQFHTFSLNHQHIYWFVPGLKIIKHTHQFHNISLGILNVSQLSKVFLTMSMKRTKA